MTNQSMKNKFKKTFATVSHFFKQKKNQKYLSLIVGLLVIILLISWSFFNWQTNPDKLLFEALANLNQLSSGQIDYRLVLLEEPKQSLALPASTTPPLDLTISAKIDFLKTNSLPQIQVAALATGPNLNSPTPEVTLVLPDTNNFFVRFNNLPAYSFLNFPAVNNQWLQFNLTSLEEKFNLNLGQSQTTIEKLSNVYRRNRFLIMKPLGQAKIDGVLADHYQVKVDENRLKKFILEFTQGKSKAKGAAGQVEAKLDQFEFIGEVWITTKDKMFKKAILDFQAFDPTKTNLARHEIVLTSINQPVSILVPTSYLEFDQSGLFALPFGMATSTSSSTINQK